MVPANTPTNQNQFTAYWKHELPNKQQLHTPTKEARRWNRQIHYNECINLEFFALYSMAS